MTNNNTSLNGTNINFIINCLSHELNCETSFFAMPENIDWETVSLLLERHRLDAHFYTLNQKYNFQISEQYKEKLRIARYANLLFGDYCKTEIHEVLTSLEAAKIPVIVLKGWAFIQWLYEGDHGQRFCEDIDILIPTNYVDLAVKTLRELDFKCIEEFGPLFSRRFRNASTFFRDGNLNKPFRKFSIGLHWGLTHHPCYDSKQVNINELFCRKVPIQIENVNVFELCFEDQIVYLCAHTALQHRNAETLQNYYEIAALIKRSGKKLNWQVIIERAKQWHYLVQVQLVLNQVNLYWSGVIPDHELTMINCSETTWLEKKLDHFVAITKSDSYPSVLLEFLTIPGLINKFTYIFIRLFPPKKIFQQQLEKN